MARAASSFLILTLLAVPTAGEVRFVLRSDGTKLMYNTDTVDGGSATLHRPDPAVASLIEQHAVRQHLDARLVQAVIQVESAYRSRAQSPKGALGLMQLMPGTATELAVADPFDPAENIRGGTTYLRRLLDRFGDLALALAAYNAGPEAVLRHGGVPPFAETRSYVQKILRLYRGDGTGGDGPAALPGRKVYLRRDADNRLVLTTSPSG